ncbi:hypothetical protein ACULNC_26480 [Shigella flexneri]
MMAREVEQTRLRVDALNQKLRQEQAQARAAQLGKQCCRSVYPQNGAGRKSHTFAGAEKCGSPVELGC